MVEIRTFVLEMRVWPLLSMFVFALCAAGFLNWISNPPLCFSTCSRSYKCGNPQQKGTFVSWKTIWGQMPKRRGQTSTLNNLVVRWQAGMLTINSRKLYFVRNTTIFRQYIYSVFNHFSDTEFCGRKYISRWQRYCKHFEPSA